MPWGIDRPAAPDPVDRVLPAPDSTEPAGIVRPTSPSGPRGPERADIHHGPRHSGCPDFDLLFDVGRIMVQGVHTAFRLRLVPLRDGHFSEVRVMIANLASQGPPLVEELDRKNWSRGVPREFRIGFQPLVPTQGWPARVFLSYRTKDGARHCYRGQVEYTVETPDTPPENILKSLQIRIDRITADRAGDNVINVNIPDLRRREFKTAAELAGHWQQPKAYDLVEMDECEPPPIGTAALPPFPAEKRLREERATLVFSSSPDGGEFHVHAVLKWPVVLGKNRRCDIVLRRFHRTGNVDRERSSFVSREHCRLRIDTGNLVLEDGLADAAGRRTGSTNGTFAGGAALPPAGDIALAPGRLLDLGLARYPRDGSIVIELLGRAWTVREIPWPQPWCGSPPAPDTPSGICLGRKDGWPEFYALVASGVRLSDAAPAPWRERLRSLWLLSWQGVLFFLTLSHGWRTEDGRDLAVGAAHPIVPGDRLQCGEIAVKVAEFRQLGLDRSSGSRTPE